MYSHSQSFNGTYHCIEAHPHSTVDWTGRFYCLLPAVCSLHHRCRSLQSCRLYWRDCVDHLWEYQDHHTQQLNEQGQSNHRRRAFPGVPMVLRYIIILIAKMNIKVANILARFVYKNILFQFSLVHALFNNLTSKNMHHHNTKMPSYFLL